MTDKASGTDIRSDISAAIRIQSQEWIESGIVPDIRSIGSGLCYEFAEELNERLSHFQGIEGAETEDWWAETFVMDIARLRAEGAPLPEGIPDDDLANILGGATHVWITWNGLHFDATAPEGKEHFLEMPFFADQLAQAKTTAKER